MSHPVVPVVVILSSMVLMATTQPAIKMAGITHLTQPETHFERLDPDQRKVNPAVAGLRIMQNGHVTDTQSTNVFAEAVTPDDNPLVIHQENQQEEENKLDLTPLVREVLFSDARERAEAALHELLEHESAGDPNKDGALSREEKVQQMIGDTLSAADREGCPSCKAAMQKYGSRKS